MVRGEPQEGHVAADPMTCRRHANACLRLAQTAKTSELSTALLSMAQSWARLAEDTEHYEPSRVQLLRANNPGESDNPRGALIFRYGNVPRPSKSHETAEN